MRKEKEIQKKLEALQNQLAELVEKKIFDYRIRRDIAIQIELLQWMLAGEGFWEIQVSPDDKVFSITKEGWTLLDE